MHPSDLPTPESSQDPAIATTMARFHSEEDYAKMSHMLRSRLRLAAFKAARGWEDIPASDVIRRVEEEYRHQHATSSTQSVLTSTSDPTPLEDVPLSSSPNLRSSSRRRTRNDDDVDMQDASRSSTPSGKRVANASRARSSPPRFRHPMGSASAAASPLYRTRGSTLNATSTISTPTRYRSALTASIAAHPSLPQQQQPSSSSSTMMMMTEDEETKQAAEAILMLASPVASPSTRHLASYMNNTRDGRGGSSGGGSPTPIRRRLAAEETTRNGWRDGQSASFPKATAFGAQSMMVAARHESNPSLPR